MLLLVVVLCLMSLDRLHGCSVGEIIVANPIDLILIYGLFY